MHFLVICENSREADKLFREFGMIMTLAKTISSAQNDVHVLKLKDGTWYRFVTKNCMDEASIGFNGRLISSKAFKRTMNTYVNQKRSSVNA